jgi:undecaprenyl-diphosphatase
MIKKIAKENKRYFLILLLLIVFFCIFKNLNGFELLKPIDQFIENIFKNMHNPNFTKLVNITSDFLAIYTLISIVVCMIFKFKNKYYFFTQVICYVLTFSTLLITKNVVCRVRPTIETFATLDVYSFPSGHTLTALVGYYFLAYIMTLKTDKKTKFAFYLIASILVVTVAFTRLYLNVHYFTDILGSILFGTIIVKCLVNIVEKNFKGKLV